MTEKLLSWTAPDQTKSKNSKQMNARAGKIRFKSTEVRPNLQLLTLTELELMEYQLMLTT